MGLKISQITSPINAEKTLERRSASAPVRMTVHSDNKAQVYAGIFMTDRSSRFSQGTDLDVTQQKQRNVVVVAPTNNDDKNENDSRDQDERTEKMGSKESYILPPDTELKNTKKAKGRRITSAPERTMVHSNNENDSRDQNERTEKMGSKESHTLPPDTKSNNTEKAKVRRIAYAPGRTMYSAQANAVIFMTDSSSRISQRTDLDVTQQKQRNVVMVLPTNNDDENENASRNQNEREVSDLTPVDQKKKSKRKEKTKRDLKETSEIGEMMLTRHNPNITDLSDPLRPTKLLEELCEIYDNEWTDAYEYLTRMRQENTDLVLKRLLNILQEVFKICMSSTETKTKALREAISNYVGLTEEDQDFKDIENRIREYRWKTMRMNKRTEKELGDQLKRILTTDIFDNLSEYIGSCVNICWKLCTREPQMYLDFGDSKEPDQTGNKISTKMHFDKDKFMSYTISGDYIEYVVWPAVYLYKDGPLMKRGVAQGIRDDKDDKDDS